MARAHLLTGAALHDQSKLSEVTNHYSATELIFEEVGDRDGSATALIQWGMILSESGDLAGSRNTIEKARDYFREVGDEIGLAATLTSMAEVLMNAFLSSGRITPYVRIWISASCRLRA